MDTQTQIEDHHVKMEAETGVMLPQAKEHQKLPEAKRDKEGFFPRDLRGNMVLLTRFWSSSLQNCERLVFRCFNPPSLWSFVTAALGNS